jgi:hypothetical protein
LEPRANLLAFILSKSLTNRGYLGSIKGYPTRDRP